MKILTAVIVISTAILPGCVSSGKYETALAEIDTMQQSLGSAQEEINRNRRQINITEQELETARTEIAAAQDKIQQKQKLLEQTSHELETAKNQVLTTQSDLKVLEEKKIALQKELSDSRSQLATLRRIEAETQRRNEIYAQFIERLKTMIDGGQLTVSIEQGRIVINLPNNVLFNSGSARLNSDGNKALTQIAGVLSQFSDRRFQIEGHTDNNPIRSTRFPSNWELSTARALAVVHIMTDLGVAAENISAAGFGEFHPRADNNSGEGRRLNRRIEIVMLPNLDILSNELPNVVTYLEDAE